MATTPALGYGTRGEAPINAVNQWMRTQPWYQQKLASWGQKPNDVHLNESQQQDIIRAAQANGVVVDEGHDGQEIDESGNFRAKGHGLRNTLIVAGIAAAALATAGAAGAFGPSALGATASTVGPSAAANIAATTAASTAVPAGIAAGAGGATAAGASAIPWGTIIGAGTNLFGNLFGAHEQASTASEAARIQAEAARYAADLQAKANTDTLAFTKSQSENAYQNSEVARQGNYGQWEAAQRRIGTLGQMLNLGPREIPAYVPGIDPNFTGPNSATTGASSGPFPTVTPGSNPLDDAAITNALTSNYKALGKSPTGPGSGPTDIAYMAGKIKETGGLTPNNISYWFGPQGRIASEVAKAASGMTGQSEMRAPKGSIASYLSPAAPTPYLQAPITPALAMPPNPYTPGTIGAYAGGW